MMYHKELIHFVDNLISDYAKYDSSSDQEVLEVQDLPDSIRCEFSALLLSFGGLEVSETLGIDNPKFDKFVIPAIINHLNNPGDKDIRSELLDQLRESITDYHTDILQQYLSDRLEIHNATDNFRDSDYEYRVAYA